MELPPLIDEARSGAAALDAAESQRYARHLSIPEFGDEGQRRMKAARVLCIGAGGLGSPIAMYLAAAGVGTIGLVDDDRVEASNLQRQLLHGTGDIGRKKLDSARDRLREVNPHVEVELHDARFTSANAMSLAESYDLLIDGTDNFPTRYLSNDVCVFLGKPNVYGSIFRFEGQCTVFAPVLGGPCYRCLFPKPPEPGLVPSCAEGGVLGVLPGIVGTLQTIEAIKLITGLGEPLVGRFLHLDALQMRFREFKLRRDPQCPVCGNHPTITEPIDYEGFCGFDDQPESPPGISVAEYAELRDKAIRHTLLDVREGFERDICTLPDSLHIPLAELPERHAELPADGLLVVHCKSGGRSAKAVAFLQSAGFIDILDLEGGIDAWSEQIDPKTPRY